MRLLIVRHGDPDYEHDTLTEKGWREAELLSERLSKLNVKEFYVSPLGRAKDTASLTLQKMNREANECLWLREFDTKIDRPDCPDRKSIPWDWLPEDWTREEEFFRRDLWATQQAMRGGLAPGAHEGNGVRVQKKPDGGVGAEYVWVVSNFDALLAEHGYVLLPLRTGVCAAVAPDECVTDDSVASYLRCTDVRHHGVYRGAPSRRGIFPRLRVRRYLAFVCGWRVSCIFGKIL